MASPTPRRPAVPLVGAMSPWNGFLGRWRNGCGSNHCPGAGDSEREVAICLARGSVPCNILFIGEGPGESENVLGQPFVGPAGILLQEQVIERAIYHRRVPVREPKPGEQSYDLEPEFSYALTNMVCCIPRDPDNGYKAAEPDDDQVVACSDRLREFIRVCDGRLQDQLRLIVAVGTLAQGWLDRGYKNSIKFHRSIRQIHIIHPAAIIRANVAQRGFLAQRAMITLRTAVEDTCR